LDPFEAPAESSDMLHCDYTTITHLYQLAVNRWWWWWWWWWWGGCLAHSNRTTPRTASRDQVLKVLATTR